MEKEVQLYQSQLEAGKVSYKKMQADLQRELQSAFQENTKLNSILEGKVPNGTVTPNKYSQLLYKSLLRCSILIGQPMYP